MVHVAGDGDVDHCAGGEEAVFGTGEALRVAEEVEGEGGVGGGVEEVGEDRGEVFLVETGAEDVGFFQNGGDFEVELGFGEPRAIERVELLGLGMEE